MNTINVMKKIMSSEIGKYLFFGVLTTLVFMIVKFISFEVIPSGFISEIIAQIIAIIFAFWTNRQFVFKSQNNNIYKEFSKFMSGRTFVLVFGVIMNFIFIDRFPNILNAIFGKIELSLLFLTIFLQVFNTIVNYLVSKFFVFK